MLPEEAKLIEAMADEESKSVQVGGAGKQRNERELERRK